MKKTIRIILCLTVLCAGFSSCAKETLVQTEEEQMVTIKLAAPTSRAALLALDDKIQFFRVLIYDSRSKTLEYNKTVADISATGANPVAIELLTKTYDFVFIANEDSDAALSAALAGLATGSRMSALDDLTVSSDAFAATKNIPMFSRYTNVKVLGDDKIQTPDMSGPEEGTWSVEVTRIGVRVDMVLTLTAGQWATFADKKLYLSNIPDKVHLSGKANDGSYESPARAITIDEATQVTDGSGGAKVITLKRIILPESAFSPASTKSNAVVAALKFGALERKAALGLSPTDFTLPRNTYLTITGTVSDKIDFLITVTPWGTPIYVPAE